MIVPRLMTWLIWLLTTWTCKPQANDKTGEPASRQDNQSGLGLEITSPLFRLELELNYIATGKLAILLVTSLKDAWRMHATDYEVVNGMLSFWHAVSTPGRAEGGLTHNIILITRLLISSWNSLCISIVHHVWVASSCSGAAGNKKMYDRASYYY